jgi:hypothetical protein
MTLGIKERLLLGTFFPPKGTKKDQSLVRSIAGKIIVTPEEKDAVDWVMEDKAIRWSAEKEKPLDIELNDEEREFLKRQVKRVDEDAEYTQELLGIAEKIENL